MHDERRKQIQRRLATLDERWTQAVDWAERDLDAFGRLGELIAAAREAPREEAARRLAELVSASPHNFAAMLMVAWVEVERRVLERADGAGDLDELNRKLGDGPGKGV